MYRDYLDIFSTSLQFLHLLISVLLGWLPRYVFSFYILALCVLIAYTRNTFMCCTLFCTDCHSILSDRPMVSPFRVTQTCLWNSWLAQEWNSLSFLYINTGQTIGGWNTRESKEISVFYSVLQCTENTKSSPFKVQTLLQVEKLCRKALKKIYCHETNYWNSSLQFLTY